MEREPLVSVVTPFYNTAPYLAECVESVLAQTYGNFEYLLVDNQSTDGSDAIARRYPARDPRVRLVRNDQCLDQVANYNGALARISGESKYVKVVQADDAIFPECLARMVELAEREPGVGLVSSHYLYGTTLGGEGLPLHASRFAGRTACMEMLVNRSALTGSPTTVLYRADLVRSRRPFYTPGRCHEDTEAAFEILLEHDLGFVHEVLSFTRTDNESIMSSSWRFNPMLLHHLMALERYGRSVLSEEDFTALRRERHVEYARYLGKASLGLKGAKFWRYHRRGLASVGLAIPWRDVVTNAVAQAGRYAMDPLGTLDHAQRSLRKRLRRGAVSRPALDPVRK